MLRGGGFGVIFGELAPATSDVIEALADNVEIADGQVALRGQGFEFLSLFGDVFVGGKDIIIGFLERIFINIQLLFVALIFLRNFIEVLR